MQKKETAYIYSDKKGYSITVHPKKLVTFDRYDDSDREEYFSEVGPIPVTDP